MTIHRSHVADWLAVAPIGYRVEVREIGDTAWIAGNVCRDVNGSGPGVDHIGSAYSHRASTIEEIRPAPGESGPYRILTMIDDDHIEYEVVGADEMPVCISCDLPKCARVRDALNELHGMEVVR